MANHKKILIIGPAWVGDMVMSQTLYKVLKEVDPNCEITVLAPKWSHAILNFMPEVKEAIELPLKHGELGIIKRYKIGKELQDYDFNHVIVLPNSFKSALIPYFAKIPLRTGWNKEYRSLLLNDHRKLVKAKYPKMIQRFAALAYPPHEMLPSKLPWPKLQIDDATINKTITKYQLSQDKPILILCPGAAFGEAKRWPEKYFAEIANEKISENWQVWLLGGKGDKQQVDNIMSLTNKQCIDLTATTLAEAIALLSLAKLVISNDSGLMHIACALTKPTIVIYGSSDPSFTPPLGQQIKIVSLHLECSPCFKRECPLQHMNCLNQLTPALVKKAQADLMVNQ